MGILLVGVVAGMLGVTQPPLAKEVGVFAGPHWPEVGNGTFVRMTAGVTIYTPLSDRLGVEFGAAYKRGGYSWTCWPCFEDEDDGESLRDYLGVSLLGQARFPLDDRLGVRAVFGPSWGLPVECRERNLTRRTERDCELDADSDVRLVVGVGAALRMSRSLDLAVSYRFGFDLRDLAAEVDGGGDLIASSLIAGITYSRNE